MDIFTTQLTKIRQQPIKPEKLRVKSLKKDAQTRALNEEKDHLTGETQSPDLHITHYEHDDEANSSEPESYSLKSIKSETPISDGVDINDDEDENKKDAGENRHIDLFV